VEIVGFMNKVGGFFAKGEGFIDKGLKFIIKKMSKGMSGGSYIAHYGLKKNIIFMSFGLPKDPWGLGVMMKEVLLDRGIKGGRFDGFSN
jgi:hypothetical protein